MAESSTASSATSRACDPGVRWGIWAIAPEYKLR
jgi:hypothetical protein